MHVRQGPKGKIFSLFFCALFLPVFPGIAGAETVAVFGPKLYLKPLDRAITHADAFRIPDDVKNCNLWLKNGSNEKNVVADFSIYVNGVELITSRNLKNRNAPISISIPEKQNIIKVLLRGQGSGQLTIGVVGEKQERDVNFVPPPRPELPSR